MRAGVKRQNFRGQILSQLEASPATVQQLVARMGIATATIRTILTVLVDAGVVVRSKDGDSKAATGARAVYRYEVKS